VLLELVDTEVTLRPKGASADSESEKSEEKGGARALIRQKRKKMANNPEPAGGCIQPRAGQKVGRNPIRA